ncbi:MAG: hypothetical protein LBK06_03660 [Planctomycetaceae bacterium]|jgi:predicted ATPase|nr:hypothetical protein [Planctomycetaceae bacterium]
MTISEVAFRSNPFSACKWQAGAIEYIFDSGVDIRGILERLTVAGGVGQIVGEHGSGKSTLLESLEKYLTKNGLFVQKIQLNSTKKNLPEDFLLSLCSSRFKIHKAEHGSVTTWSGCSRAKPTAHTGSGIRKKDTNTIYILDGYEQLSLLARIRLRLNNLRNTGGFIFTTHKPAIFVPIIYKTIARAEIFQNLVRNLIKNNNFKIDNKQIEKIFKESKGNFRDGFFKLYDLFEESR